MTTYAEAGIDIDATDSLKQKFAESMKVSPVKVLSEKNSFAALVDGRFSDYEHPILVLKTEEPGSKQKLALDHGSLPELAKDLVHHLINDIVVMGAKPYAMLDTIIVGKLESQKLSELVSGIADACRAHGCALVGGETSLQPGVLPEGVLVVSASVVGVVEQKHIIDGKKCQDGDLLIALGSNGLHTNGYTLVRKLLQQRPALEKEKVGSENFLTAILKPHLSYYSILQKILSDSKLHALAHITGGGIEGNLSRVLPSDLNAEIELSDYEVPEIFSLIQKEGGISEAEMFRTFNMGFGMIAIVAADSAPAFLEHFGAQGAKAWICGRLQAGSGKVILKHGR